MAAINLAKFKPIVCDLIEYYREDMGNGAGGSLHTALDDGNLDDGDIWLCQEEAQKRDDDMGYFIATILRHFTEHEREEMYEADWPSAPFPDKEPAFILTFTPKETPNGQP